MLPTLTLALLIAGAAQPASPLESVYLMHQDATGVAIQVRSNGYTNASSFKVRLALGKMLNALMRRIERAGVRGRTLVLKVRYADFRLITRSRTMGTALGEREVIAHVAASLVDGLDAVEPGIRLVGLTLSNLAPHEPSGSAAQPALPL